jgi:hypothetical protein
VITPDYANWRTLGRMNRVWTFGLALIISISCAAQNSDPAEPPEITVRLLDCRSGTPYADKLVTIQFFHAENTTQPPDMKARTAADGTVVFSLPEMTPPGLFKVFPGTSNDLYPCSDMVFKPTDLDRIISEGVVSRCSKKTQGCRCKFGKALADIHTRPHELVILTRPITVGERIRWHIWE